ncbi:hypothetical protein [Actinoplanes sp. NPDC051411]|uniref:hypothetical protein n=1 Tax=Actinoplanes sp. NPDC051411 TaxID=3155522 RepID=UPI00341B09CA
MLFLFRGRHGPLVRIILGAIMVAVGLLLHGWVILAAVGAVLLIWGVFGLVSEQRNGRVR